MMDLVMKIADSLKQIDSYESEVNKRLVWVRQEIQNPTPVAGMTLEYKVEQLKKVEEQSEETLDFLMMHRQKLKAELENRNVGPLIEVAEIMNSMMPRR